MKLVEMIASWMACDAGKKGLNGTEWTGASRSDQGPGLGDLNWANASRMVWSIVGMNRHPFVHTRPVTVDSPVLRQRLQALRRARLHSAANRDLACAIEVGVKVVRDRPAERCGIIYLAAGRVCSSEVNLNAAIDFAVSRGVPVHGIYLGNDLVTATGLEWVCTKADLRFGSFHTANQESELEEALRRCTRGLIAPAWLKGFNRVVFIVDLTDEMAEPFGATCRIEACAHVLETLIGSREPEARNFASHTESAMEWHPSSVRAA